MLELVYEPKDLTFSCLLDIQVCTAIRNKSITPKPNYSLSAIRHGENLNEDAMLLPKVSLHLTDFTALVSRNEKLTLRLRNHRTLFTVSVISKNFRPEHICYRKDRPEELAIINYIKKGQLLGFSVQYQSFPQ